MKYYFLPMLVFVLSTCGDERDTVIEKELVDVYNYNVIIAPDLSNRIDPKIHPKPVHDTVIINDLFEQIPELIKTGNRKSQQMDVFTFDFINGGALNKLAINQNDLKIDFSQFESRQLERSDYIRKGLERDVATAKKNVAAVYQYAHNNRSGADIFNYLNATVNNVLVPENFVISEITPQLDARTSTKNVIVIFTDGYIENVTKGSGFQFSGSSVKKIREHYKKSNIKNLNQFIKENSQYHINPLTNSNLRDANILVVEMVDRSLDQYGVATEHPTDFVIMRAVWENWFKDSNVKDCDFVQAQNTSEQTLSHIKKFIAKQSVKAIDAQ